jgi:multidrug efflux pump subunit AcrA (membrane-fusion protein)
MKTRSGRRIQRSAAFLIASCCLLATGCGLLPAEEEVLAPPLVEPQKIEYRTHAVARGSLIAQLRMTGILVPSDTRALSFEDQGGRLAIMHIQMGQEVKAGDLIAELESGSLDDQIALQELEVEKIVLDLANMRATGAGTYAIKRTEIDLKQQRIRLAALESAKEATVIRAPIDGQITYTISTPRGEYINAYQIVARVSETSKMLLVTNDIDAGELPIGAGVQLEYKTSVLAGEVVANPSTLFNDPDERLRTAAVIEFVAGFPEDAKLGDTLRITYIQDQRLDVIVLPRSLVNLMSGRKYVNVLLDGVRVEKDVEIGLMTDTEAEILTGLDEGDLVIMG